MLGAVRARARERCAHALEQRPRGLVRRHAQRHGGPARGDLVGDLRRARQHQRQRSRPEAGRNPMRALVEDRQRLRRRDSGQWGHSLCKVLRARGQFALSTTSKNYVFDDAESWNQAWLVAGVALDLWKLPAAWRPSLVPNADHFYAADAMPMPPGWAKGPPLAVIGDHRFYHAD